MIYDGHRSALHAYVSYCEPHTFFSNGLLNLVFIKFAGWLTVGPDLSSSNFSSETYNSYFSNGPDDYLVGCTPEIETLRPKSPPLKNKNPQQPGGRGGGRGAGRGVGRGGPPEQGIATIPVIRGRGVPGPLDGMPRGGGFSGRGMPFIPHGGYQPR